MPDQSNLVKLKEKLTSELTAEKFRRWLEARAKEEKPTTNLYMQQCSSEHCPIALYCCDVLNLPIGKVKVNGFGEIAICGRNVFNPSPEWVKYFVKEVDLLENDYEYRYIIPANAIFALRLAEQRMKKWETANETR